MDQITVFDSLVGHQITVFDSLVDLEGGMAAKVDLFHKLHNVKTVILPDPPSIERMPNMTRLRLNLDKFNKHHNPLTDFISSLNSLKYLELEFETMFDSSKSLVEFMLNPPRNPDLEGFSSKPGWRLLMDHSFTAVGHQTRIQTLETYWWSSKVRDEEQEN